jgi:hyperosmotically inducible protein
MKRMCSYATFVMTIGLLTGTMSVPAAHAQSSSSQAGVPDAQLQKELVKKIEYSREGYGSTAFNAISVKVHDGLVLLGGHAVGPVSASTAVNLAKSTKGVQKVIDKIQVDPLSPMDNGIRRAEFRAIYGFPSLNRYAINPLKPIRISVQNGHVTLYGVVDSQADKNAAGIRANTVPGVFSVTNNLEVAGQEKP